MISIFSGSPGSGKSYHATSVIYDSLCFRRRPRPVICNYDLNLPKNADMFHYVPNDHLTPDRLVDFANDWFGLNPVRQDSILLVLDEAQLLWNSRLWNEAGRNSGVTRADGSRSMSWLEFFSQHRHWGYEIILIAQSAQMVDRQFRSLVEYDVVHRQFSNFGFVGGLIGALFLGRLHVAVTRYYGMHERLGSHWFVIRPKICRMYDTFATFRGRS